MANRLTKIYTRTGDKGTTRLATGAEVHKTHPRVEAMGTVDELNSLIGVVDSHLSEADDLSPVFRRIQNDLFDLGGEIAIADDSYVVISLEMINWLEEVLDHSTTPYHHSRTSFFQVEPQTRRILTLPELFVEEPNAVLWN